MISIEKLVEILFIDQFQDIETATHSLLDKWDIDNLEGEPLNEIAKIIGLKKYSSDTDTMRAFLKAKAVINSSKGKFKDIYAVAKGISETLGGTELKIIDYHPQQLNIMYDVIVDPTLAELIIELIQDAASVEVLINGIELITTEGDGVFKYDSSSLADSYDNGVYTDFMRNR